MRRNSLPTIFYKLCYKWAYHGPWNLCARSSEDKLKFVDTSQMFYTIGFKTYFSSGFNTADLRSSKPLYYVSLQKLSIGNPSLDYGSYTVGVIGRSKFRPLRETDRQTDTQKDRHCQRDRGRENGTERQRQRQKGTEAERDRDRDRDRSGDSEDR